MAVILPSTYTDGTAVCTNGTPNVVGTGTMWLNTILPGDFFWSPSGESVRVLNVVDDTHITLAYNWPGVTQVTGPYEIRFQADQGRVQETTRQLLERMQSGNLYAFAGLAGMTDLIPYFTGPGAMGLLSKVDLVNGVTFDVQVDTLADRAPYDTQVTGYTVLVSNTGDGRSAIYSKMSSTPGDWSDPAYITGPSGLNWRGVWSNATAYVEDDAVSYNGASYIALTGNTNVTPVAGATWGVLATRGATGLTGINPRGTYAGATAYAVTDSVLYNGSTWVATVATTGNAPPTLPATSNAWWQLLAQKGVDGTGTGDVVGPAGVTDGYSAMFDGVTGKLIKGLSPAQFRTWLAQTAASVSFSNTTANLPGNPTTVQAAIEAIGNSGGKNDAVFALEIADLKGVRMGMNGGIADSFDDTTGIVTAQGGIDSNSLSVLHFDGANASTTMTDSAPIPHAWTPVGNAQISTAQSKFGGASLLLDGTGDWLTTPSSADFSFGTGDFTLETWVRPTVVNLNICLFDFRSGAGDMVNIVVVCDGSKFAFYAGGYRIVGTTTPVVNTWYHVALVRASGVTKLYVNGVQEGSSYADTTSYGNPAGVIVGAQIGATSGLTGNMDELRMSNIARWTANFTPPSAAYFIDTANSYNYIYDAANDWFQPSKSIQVAPTGAITGSTAVTLYTMIDRGLPMINGASVKAIGMYSTIARSATVKIARRVSAGVYDILASYVFAHPGGGWYDFTLPAIFNVPSTGLIYPAEVYPGSGTVSNIVTAARSFITGDIAVSSGVSGWTEDAGTQLVPIRFDYVPDNMQLRSVTYPAATVPGTARIALQLAGSVSFTPNTDFSMEVSRDGGNTWTTAVLALTVNYGGVMMYEAVVSLSGQPSGSNMVWRMKSLTNKNVIASGVVLQQS